MDASAKTIYKVFDDSNCKLCRVIFKLFFFCVKMDNSLYIVKSSAIDYNNQYFSIFR